MMDQEKVKLMMKLATFEKKEGKEDLNVMEYFKGDYIAYKTFLILLGVSFSLFLFFLADIGMKFFEDMQRFIEYDFVELGIRYLTIWVVFMVIYGIVSTIIYKKRYRESKQRIDDYQKMLKELRKM